MKALRRGAFVAVVLVFCLLLSGCDWQAVLEEMPITVVTPPSETATLPHIEMPLTVLENGYAYTLLNDIQQKNYEAAVSALYDHRGQNTSVKGEYGLSVELPHALTSEEEIHELFMAVYDDHPEFFYLTTQYGWMSVEQSFTSVCFYYAWDADERARKATELEAAVSSLVTQAQGLSPVEQELFFHDALTERGEYNQEATVYEDGEPDAEYFAASSPYAALCSGDPICGGYSRAFQLLLARAGIACTAVVNEDHGWTMVWLDGEPYHVDVTWDDPQGGEAGYAYFNLTDDEIRATRDYPAQPRMLPEATATAYNYHVMNGWYFSQAEDERLGDVIREQIRSGREMVELRFDSDIYAQAVQYLFEDQGFFEAVYELEEDVLRDCWYSEVVYTEDETLGILKICANETDNAE